LDVSGLDVAPEQIEAALEVDVAAWRTEAAGIEEWFTKLGPELSTALRDELDSLLQRLDIAPDDQLETLDPQSSRQ
jgi:phosphoenolpyruvate carboxykinase (GTP)